MHYINFDIVFTEAGEELSALHALVHFILHLQFLPIFYQSIQFSRGSRAWNYFQVGKSGFQQISGLSVEKRRRGLFLKALWR